MVTSSLRLTVLPGLTVWLIVFVPDVNIESHPDGFGVAVTTMVSDLPPVFVIWILKEAEFLLPSMVLF